MKTNATITADNTTAEVPTSSASEQPAQPDGAAPSPSAPRPSRKRTINSARPSLKKQRALTHFSTLPQEQLDVINELVDRDCTYKQVVEKMKSFGCKVCIGTVSTYFTRRVTERRLERALELAPTVHRVIEQFEGEDAPNFSRAAIFLLEAEAFQVVNRGEASPSHLKALFDIIHRERRIQIQQHQFVANFVIRENGQKPKSVREAEFDQEKIESMTGEERRIASFNALGVHGKQLDLHMARIDRELVQEQIRTGRKIPLIFDYELPATLEEAAAREDAARAALGLPSRAEKMRQLHRIMAERGATFSPLPEYCRGEEQESANENKSNPEENWTPVSTQAPGLCDRTELSDVSDASQEATPAPSSSAALPPTPEEMRVASEQYTLARAYEHIAYVNAQRHDFRPNKPGYETALKECPCGSRLPCPWHEEFDPFFWRVSPFSIEYAKALRDRGIPYREPEELLA